MTVRQLGVRLAVAVEANERVRDERERKLHERIARLVRERSTLRGELRRAHYDLRVARASRDRWRERAHAAEWGERHG